MKHISLIIVICIIGISCENKKHDLVQMQASISDSIKQMDWLIQKRKLQIEYRIRDSLKNDPSKLGIIKEQTEYEISVDKFSGEEKMLQGRRIDFVTAYDSLERELKKLQ